MTIQEVLERLSHDPLAGFGVPIFIIAILVELVISRRRHLNLYAGRDTATSFCMLILSAIVEFLPKIAAFYLFFQLHEISPLRDLFERQWWAWLILFVLDDFTYYWFHRANHEVRVLWAGHVSHHSSTHLNFGTALRQGVGERVHKYFFWMWLPLLGFDPLMIFTVISINLFYQFWVHTDLIDKCPEFIERFLNTPSHHRVHHASNIRYLDCNHAGVLIVWDKLFGTFSEQIEDEQPVYGLTTNIDTFNPWVVVSHEYAALWRDLKRATTWQAKLSYLFLAPGWNHDGEDRRARTLRKL